MIEADTLKQLEDALTAYREDQETLDPVVKIAEQALGEEWVNELPSELSSALEGKPNASELLEKAEHVVHYYGALTAWEEASSYVSGKEPYTPELLQERLPVLEYWLKLFGEDGDVLMGQVKELLENASIQEEKIETVEQDAYVEPSSEETFVEQKTEENIEAIEQKVTIEPQVVVSPEKTVVEQNTEDKKEAKPSAAPVMPEPIASDEEVSEESILATPKEETVVIENKLPVEEVVPVAEVEDTVPQSQEQETVVQNVETVVQDVEEKATPREEVVSEEKVETVSEENTENTFTLSKQDKDIPILDVLEKVDLANQNASETTTEEQSSASSVADKALSELEQLRSVNDEGPIFHANDYVGLDTPAETVSEKKETEPEEKAPEIQDVAASDYANVPMESKNWDIAVFLRQQKLYEEACNWLSAWCIRMDSSDKTEYPYYGFIVDLMYDLKDKANNILDNQLLDEIVEKDVDGGRATVEKVVEALDKEIEGLPDDLKLSTPERIKLSAQEILGKIDTSTEKEDIEAPPDGFELMDDPYAVSTEQLKSDFDKIERETEKKIDNLNIIDENK